MLFNLNQKFGNFNIFDRFLYHIFCEVKFVKLRGQGGPRPKIIFNVIFVEGRQSYQMLFTRLKNIDPSLIYRIFKIAKYIQLPCGRALYLRLSQNFKF